MGEGESDMKAREAIRKASFEPKDLAVIGRAFDETWAAVASCFDTPLAKTAARLVLANAILGHATKVSVEPSDLRRAGLAVLIAKYPRQVSTSHAAYLFALIAATQSAVASSQIHIDALRASVRRADSAIRRSVTLLRDAHSQDVIALRAYAHRDA